MAPNFSIHNSEDDKKSKVSEQVSNNCKASIQTGNSED